MNKIKNNINTEIVSINTSDVCPKNDNDKRCAPGLRFDAGSCIELSVLVEMAGAYNKDAGESSIVLSRNLEVLNPRKYKKYLVSEFNKRLGEKCTTQKCWTEQKFIKQMEGKAKDQLENYTFRPDGPNGRFEWLNTINIKQVMGQYEKKYPNFKFLGAVPIDFDNFDDFNIKNLDYAKLVKSGKTKFGVVFNMDEHDEPGSHWVAMYSDFDKGEVLFFDSYGTKPEKRIRKLMRRHIDFVQKGLGRQLTGGEIKADYNDYNQIRHQYEGSECGVYSINFILRMVRGDSFGEVCKSKIPDKKINKCRNVYFGNTNI
jgi:hypothetical protein